MTIGYDAKRFFNNFTGLGNYSRFIVDAVSRYYPDNHYYLYSPKAKSHPEIDQIVSRDHVHVVKPGVIGSTSFLKSIWRSWGMSFHPTVSTLDIYHGLSHELPIGLPARIKKVVTVHDLIFMRYPQFYNPVDVRIYKAKVKSACNRADRIVAISQQTKDDLIDFLNIDPLKIDVVYQGCHPIFKKSLSQTQLENVRAKYNLPQEYILNVGTIESRKNAVLIVNALAQLPAEERKTLVIVGRETSYKQEVIQSIVRHNLENKVMFIHDAKFIDLPAIYQMSALFVYPSLFEGFGIPIVEAIESGIPVITTSGSCFAEAGGTNTWYVEPTDYEQLGKTIREVFLHKEETQKRVQQSKAFASNFSSEKIATDMCCVYKMLV